MRFVSIALGIIAMAAGLTTVAVAQPNSALIRAARQMDDFNRKTANVNRDAMNSEMSGKKLNPEEIRRAKALEVQIENDLSSLQTDYNSLVTKLGTREPFDNKFVAETADKINGHADRLRKNIAFPKPESEKPPTEMPTADGRKAVVELCSRILAFFDSPIFENPNVLDIKDASAARQKLDAIIRLSAVLKNAAQ